MGDALFACFARHAQFPTLITQGGERKLGGVVAKRALLQRDLRSELVVLVRFWTGTEKHGGERSEPASL